MRERRDLRLPKGVDLTGEHLPQGKKDRDKEMGSLLGTTKSPTTKKEKRVSPLRILRKADFLKAKQRSGASVLPYREVEKKGEKKEALAASLPVKNQVALRNGKAKSLLLFPRSLLAKNQLDSKKILGKIKSLTIHNGIKSPMQSEADLGIKNRIQSAVVPTIKSPIQNAVALTIKNPMQSVAGLEIKKKVFQRILDSARKRDSRRILLPKNPV